MLETLRIQNIVLIEEAEIQFKNNLCALTGETGAGKSILLDALGLAIGARAESRLVRKGAEQAQAVAVFSLPSDHPVYALMAEAGIETEPGEPVILRRSLSSDGRSRAFINDQPVSISLLRQTGDTLVEIHGQFETQGLLNPATHAGLLDEYAGVEAACTAEWQAWQSQAEELQSLKARADHARAEEDFLRQAVADLDALDPKPGEEDELSSLRESLQHRERVLEALNAAYHILSGDDDPVRSAWGQVERVADKIGEPAEPIIASLSRASADMQEALSQIQSLSADLQDSDHNLESIDDRLFALRAQARKHNCTIEDLPQKREELAAQLNEIDHADDLLSAKTRLVEQARAAYIKAAEACREKRLTASEKLDKLVARELPPLKLEKARFETDVSKKPEEEWGPRGMDQIRFLVATNPGAEPGPLSKIASGGEMSRFMLALKVVMAETGTAPTLIFDEVDAGIGGATADAVGERLARLAATHQVLVVTHAPQVAARAAHHYIVLKEGRDDVKTQVQVLAETHKRREEIARMLAGAEVTQEARAAADKLLEAGTSGKAA